MFCLVFTIRCFNTQPPEGGWGRQLAEALPAMIVSTHSRPKAAGFGFDNSDVLSDVSTHSRPKAAGEVDLF